MFPSLFINAETNMDDLFVLKFMKLLDYEKKNTNHKDHKQKMFTCHEHGTKKNCESPTGIEPMASQITTELRETPDILQGIRICYSKGL